MTATTTDRQAALDAWQAWLTELGLASFPLYGVMNGRCRCRDGDACPTPGKHPKITGWRHLTEPARAGELDNLGVSTDKLVVVDVDAGEIPEDLPDTFTVSTGRGYHLWYAANPSHRIGNAAGWRHKIDIRSYGGLVVAPPSKHVSGTVYEHYRGDVIAPVPQLILDSFTARRARASRPAVTEIPEGTNPLTAPLVAALIREMEEATEGQRDMTLFRTSCRFFELAEKGWAGEDSLRELFDAAVRTGLSPSQAASTIQSASRSLTQ
jgi:hypothetical protein